MPRETAVKDEEEIRITQQFRAGEAMVYDFRGPSFRLTVRVSGRGGEETGPPAEWGVEASTSTSFDSAIVAEWASTRAEALRAVGRAWAEKRLANNLPVVDWASVERAMSAVRAI
jgi:hypothetical protein